MQSWKPGDRVEHATFGHGTLIEFNAQHAIIHFDDHGQKRFASHLVVLARSQRPTHAAVARRSRTSSERPTDIGYENLNEQTVVRQATISGDLPGEKVYVLRCGRCGAEYGAKERDLLERRCPSCMGAKPGLSV